MSRLDSSSAIQSCQELYRNIYEAIEPYDLKLFLREAEEKGVLSPEENRQIEAGRGSTKRRVHLVKLVIGKDLRQQQLFINFIGNYASNVQKVSIDALITASQFIKAAGSTSSACLPTYCQSVGGEVQQLSQDSSTSDSISSMEFDVTDSSSSDVGYFTQSHSDSLSTDWHSVGLSPHAAAGVGKSSLEYAQTNQRSFQKYAAKKRQDLLGQPSIPTVPCVQSLVAVGQAGVHVMPTVVQGHADLTSVIYKPGTVQLQLQINNNYFVSDADRKGTALPRPLISSPPANWNKDGYCVESPHDQNDKASSGYIIWSKVEQHYPRIIRTLNARVLEPLLIQKGLLTPDEREELESRGYYDQNKYLLRILPRKGENSFKLFLECLREEKTHMGHEDIAKWLNK